MNEIEFMVRVQLPNPNNYHSSPSGDSQFDDDYKKAIFDNKPPGFEVMWPRLNEKWPIDSEGYTYVRLYLSDQTQVGNGQDRLIFWVDEANKNSKALKELKAKLRKLFE